MRSRAAGLWYIRRGPAMLMLVVLTLAFVWFFPEMSIPVSVDPERPPRGIGAPEICSIALASALPALTVPLFDGRELLSGLAARTTHAIYSLVIVALPLAVFPVWVTRIRALQPLADLPPSWGLAATPLVFSCVAMTACLLLGRAWSVVVPVVAFAALTVGQHLHPDSPLTAWFASGRHWHTAWWVWIGATIGAGVVIWRTRSIPWPDRKG